MGVPLTRFSILSSNYSYGLRTNLLFKRLTDIAAAMEESIFDTLWLPDHLVQGSVGDIAANRGDRDRTLSGPNGKLTPIFDAPTLLGALAAITKTLRIGPLVSPVTFRHPALLAKLMTTVDVVSGGRAVLGFGAAWDADEHKRYGFDFPPPRERLDRLEEGTRICRAMFDEVAASYAGRYYSIEEAYNVPRPVSDRIPILIGGHGRRTLRIAATYADACNPVTDRGEVFREAFETLAKFCEEIGRDPAEVGRPGGILFHRREDLYRQVEEAFGAGCDGVILVPWQISLSPDDIFAIGSRLASEYGR